MKTGVERNLLIFEDIRNMNGLLESSPFIWFFISTKKKQITSFPCFIFILKQTGMRISNTGISFLHSKFESVKVREIQLKFTEFQSV